MVTALGNGHEPQLPSANAEAASIIAPIANHSGLVAGATSILTPLPSREPDMSRLVAARAAVQQEEPMTMSPGQSLESSQ